jgi:hypothetical protein
MHRHFQRAGLADVTAHSVVRDVNGIALRCAGQVEHGLCQCQFTLRAAQAFLHVPCIDAQPECARVGIADVFRGHACDTARQVERVTATVQHAHQPVQRGVRIRAAYRLVQCGNLVIKIIAALVKAPVSATEDFREVCFRNTGDTILLRGKVGGNLQQVECTPCITVGGNRQTVEPRVIDHQPAIAQSVRCVLQGVVDDPAQGIRFQPLQYIGACAGQQCTVQFKRGILGSGANENDRAIFHIGQKGILLGLVEAVCLVDEQDGLAPFQFAYLLRHGNGRTNILDARQHRRQRNKFRMGVISQQSCKRGLAGARRSPQHHGMQVAFLDGAAQWLAGSQDVRLPGEGRERARSHAIGQWPIGFSDRRHDLLIYCTAPMTSAPAGGTKWNRSSASGSFRVIWLKRNMVVLPKLS